MKIYNLCYKLSNATGRACRALVLGTKDTCVGTYRGVVDGLHGVSEGKEKDQIDFISIENLSHEDLSSPLDTKTINTDGEVVAS